METATTKWAIDAAHSEILFKVKHLVISTVSGKFDTFEGTVVTKGDTFDDAQVEFSAETASINTGNADRDGHLQSGDFFDVANHPKLTFKSKSFKRKSDDAFVMTGILSLRGVAKEVELNVEYGGTTVDPWGNTKAGFEVTGKINRKDYGLSWSAATEAGGLVVSDEVKLQFGIELLKQA